MSDDWELLLVISLLGILERVHVGWVDKEDKGIWNQVVLKILASSV